MLVGLFLSLHSPRPWTAPAVLATIDNPILNESSGIGESTRFPGVYYTHNDSGDSARFFRFKPDGTLSAVTLTGASATDWEDMEYVAIAGKHFLYFADFGDNNAKRDNVRVYRLEEPSLTANAVNSYETYTITYPDGPHNCEALIVNPANGDIYFATKSTTECAIYKLPAPATSGSFTLTRLGAVSPNTGGGNSGKLVTAGSADPTGHYVVLRTYTGALEYKVSGPFGDWWKQTPTPVTMPVDLQGEAIAYGRAGRTLVTSSEGTPFVAHIQRLLDKTGKG